MSKFIISKTIACPFYKWHQTNRICCEGTEATNNVNLVFSDGKDCKAYRERYCMDIHSCEECILYQMLDLKYPEGG